MTNSASFGYAWLDWDADRPGALMNEASLFGFFEGVTAADVVRLSGMQHAVVIDLSDDPEPWKSLFEIDEGPSAVFAIGRWTVLYQDNSFPEHVARGIAQRQDLRRAVIVFWNVNALVNFELWEQGVQIDGFSEMPSERYGTDRSRLNGDMAAVGLVDETDDEPLNYNVLMMALGDRITGEHLSANFLQRPDVVIGSLPMR